MDAVIDFLSESLAPTSPTTSSPPTFLRKGQSLGDLTAINSRQSSHYHSLTPLERSLLSPTNKGDTPVKKHLTFQEDTEQPRDPPEVTTLPLTIPNHLLSSLKKNTEHAVEPTMSSSVPIFTADDTPLSAIINPDYTINNNNTANTLLAESNRPTALHHPSIKDPNTILHSSPYSVFSPDDSPLINVRPSSVSSLHSAFSMPTSSLERKLPGYPKRIDDSTTIPVSISLSGQPHSLTGQPHSLTGQPHSLTGQPHSLTDQPHSLTGQPHSLTTTDIQTTDTDDNDTIQSSPQNSNNMFNRQLSDSTTVSIPEIPVHVKATKQYDVNSNSDMPSLRRPSVISDVSSVYTGQPRSRVVSVTDSQKDYESYSAKDDSMLPLATDTSNKSFPVIQKPLMPSREKEYYKLPTDHSINSNVAIATGPSEGSVDIVTRPVLSEVSPLLSSMPPLQIPSYNESSDSLKERIYQLMKEKANLEGQLESVVKECQETLKNRTEMQSKLTKAETELATARDQIKSNKKQPMTKDGDEEGSELLVEMGRLESALRKKRQEMAVMTRELKQIKKHTEDMSNELGDSKENIEKKNAELRELSSVNTQLKEQIDESTETIEELSNDTANLKASLDSMESAKTWLHKQLQDEIQSKLSLQEKLRELRTGSVSQTVRTDQLERENSLLNQQIDELRNKVLKDKANLVNELEAIEADVLSKESSYVEMETTKKQMEEMLELRNNQLEEMGDEMAELKARVAEIESTTSDNNRSTELLATQLKRLEDDNKILNNALQHERQVVENKDRKLNELKKAKTSFQQRLQQAETGQISKEGELQGLKDVNEMIRQELDGVKMAREYAETELVNTQKSLAEMEVALEEAEMKLKQNSNELQSAKNKLQNNEKVLNAMKSQLSNKENELDQKSSELILLEDQSSELVDQFRSLQSQFHSIADESGLGTVEKDRVINHLANEKEQLDNEFVTMKNECDRLKESVKELEMKNARLSGELESVIATSPKMDEIKKILKDKNALESRLGAERISHQQEAIKCQAKIARLQNLTDDKKDSKRKIKELQAALDSMQRDIDMKNSQTDHDLNKTHQSDIIDEITSLRKLLNEKQNELELNINRQEVLKKENCDLKQQLEEESSHVIEIERASTLVASHLKQSALEKERQLNEEIQQLIINSERLKGQIEGTEKAQQCLREHVNVLESAVAQKEGQLSTLASEMASLLSDKEIEIEDLKCTNGDLYDSVSGLKAELEKLLTDGLFDKQRVDDLERELIEKESRFNNMTKNSVDNNEREDLKQQLSELVHQKEDIQAEVRTMKQQLSLSQTSYECIKRELQEKTEYTVILEKKLQLTQEQLATSQDELTVLKQHIQSTGEQYREEMGSLNRTSQWNKGVDHVDSAVNYDDNSINSTDEVVSSLKDQNSIYKAQLQEIQGRLVKARQEGQEAAENKTIGEIQSLHTQLGAKSKTLRTLQDCVTSLKDEMNTMQSQMSVHSSVLANSYRSSREIENKIVGLQQSQTSRSGSPFNS